MKLPPGHDAALALLAGMSEWQILQHHIQAQIEIDKRRLTTERFEDLPEVARLQGEITAYRWVLQFVNNRRQKKGA